MELAKLQAWFGQAISQPLPEIYATNPLAVSLPNLRAEADARLKEKGAFTGFDRLGVYNQQYWFRLITIMQDEYPCTVHLLGLRSFNGWAVQYLLAYPPVSPYLAELDLHFPDFMVKHYSPEHSKATLDLEAMKPEQAMPVVLEAIAYDRAFSKGFDAPAGITIAEAGLSDPSEIMTLAICLAPHVSPLTMSYDFAAYRELCLSDESLEAVFVLHPAESHVVIYRDRELSMQIKAVSKVALKVLTEFRATSLLADVFARLDGMFSPAEQLELEAGLTTWFQFWVAEGWLVLDAKAT
jgi:hypothetical protein